MKFNCTIEIEKPIGKVVELFDNPDNLKKWQPELVSFEHLSGIAGQPGAKSRIVYQNKKHIIELTETIITKNLPDEMTALYEHKHMVNTMSNRFVALDNDRTRWEVGIGYTKFIGFMPKLMAFLMSGMFKKQTYKWLEEFKKFAEKEN